MAGVAAATVLVVPRERPVEAVTPDLAAPNNPPLAFEVVTPSVGAVAVAPRLRAGFAVPPRVSEGVVAVVAVLAPNKEGVEDAGFANPPKREGAAGATEALVAEAVEESPPNREGVEVVVEVPPNRLALGAGPPRSEGAVAVGAAAVPPNSEGLAAGAVPGVPPKRDGVEEAVLVFPKRLGVPAPAVLPNKDILKFVLIK